MIPGASLLRMLASPGAATAAPAPTSHDPSSPAFAALLEKARAGEVSSGREVSIATSANLKLTPDQLQRLAVAADRAEAQGATRAVVLIDGQALRLDVTMREITGSVDLAVPGVFTNIDAFITAPEAPGASKSATPMPGEGRAWSNASLLKSLADAGEDHNHDAR
jgi:hypothetical protein